MSLALLAASLLAGTPAGADQASPSASSVPTSTASRMPASPSASAPDPGSTSTPAAPAVVIVPVPDPLPMPSARAVADGLSSGPRAAAQQKVRLGDQLLAAGDTRTALFAYQDAANQDPQSAEARLKLGRVYLLLDHPDEALEQFGVAVALDPGAAEAREALERARSRRGGDVPPPGSPVVARMPGGADAGRAAEVPPAAPQARP